MEDAGKAEFLDEADKESDLLGRTDVAIPGAVVEALDNGLDTPLMSLSDLRGVPEVAVPAAVSLTLTSDEAASSSEFRDPSSSLISTPQIFVFF